MKLELFKMVSNLGPGERVVVEDNGKIYLREAKRFAIKGEILSVSRVDYWSEGQSGFRGFAFAVGFNECCRDCRTEHFMLHHRYLDTDEIPFRPEDEGAITTEKVQEGQDSVIGETVPALEAMEAIADIARYWAGNANENAIVHFGRFTYHLNSYGTDKQTLVLRLLEVYGPSSTGVGLDELGTVLNYHEAAYIPKDKVAGLMQYHQSIGPLLTETGKLKAKIEETCQRVMK